MEQSQPGKKFADINAAPAVKNSQFNDCSVEEEKKKVVDSSSQE